MKERINVQELEPSAYQVMFSFEKYVSTSTLDKSLCELVRLRASFINGCAYCIELHAQEALKLGVDQKKTFAIGAYRESPKFSEKEKAVLSATDEITNISKKGLSDATFENLKLHITDNEIVQLIMLIGLINVWNRIAISTHTIHKD